MDIIKYISVHAAQIHNAVENHNRSYQAAAAGIIGAIYRPNNIFDNIFPFDELLVWCWRFVFYRFPPLCTKKYLKILDMKRKTGRRLTTSSIILILLTSFAVFETLVSLRGRFSNKTKVTKRQDRGK